MSQVRSGGPRSKEEQQRARGSFVAAGARLDCESAYQFRALYAALSRVPGLPTPEPCVRGTEEDEERIGGGGPASRAGSFLSSRTSSYDVPLRRGFSVC